MSCIASAVSRRIASGATWRKVRPFASKVETPSVVTSRYGVSSGPVGRRSEYSNSGSAEEAGEGAVLTARGYSSR